MNLLNLEQALRDLIAWGAFFGKNGRDRNCPGDNRSRVVHFDADVWPHVYAGVKRSSRSPPRSTVRWPTWRSAG
ncbi:MAG: hypothetical protein R2932_20935 [Caldilineaceae bacterium]